MRLRNSTEVVYVACRMEENAISLYQRALMVCPESIRSFLQCILKQEQHHLCTFRSIMPNEPLDFERSILLSAFAENILYEGGLHGAAREGLLDSSDSLLLLATKAESDSVEKYRSFAEISKGKTKEMLLFIAEEEAKHYHDLCGLSNPV